MKAPPEVFTLQQASCVMPFWIVLYQQVQALLAVFVNILNERLTVSTTKQLLHYDSLAVETWSSGSAGRE